MGALISGNKTPHLIPVGEDIFRAPLQQTNFTSLLAPFSFFKYREPTDSFIIGSCLKFYFFKKAVNMAFLSWMLCQNSEFFYIH